MGPISRANDRQTNPYLLWQEKIAERAADKAKETDEKNPGVQGAERPGDEKESGSAKETKNVPLRRTRDEYVPEGRRVLDNDKDPDADKIVDHGKAQDTGKAPESNKASKSADGKKPEVVKVSTDKVDREIEKLKKRKEELEGQIRAEKDERKLQSLEGELAQVERELSRQDNDTYRRQHMEVTKM